MKRLIIVLGTIWLCSSFFFDAEAYIHQANANSPIPQLLPGEW